MTLEPQIKMLPYKSRSRFFMVLFGLFVVLLPAFIFYTSGYRLNFDNEGNVVVTTGGIYVTTDELEVDVYIDEGQIERPRLFRSAYYIQNIEAGMHRIVVQGEGLHTWVKELPVDPYIVTEVAAFNMPVIPHIRPIPEYHTQSGVGVFFAESTSTELFPEATTTVDFIVTDRPATTTYNASSEFEYVDELFNATTTASSSSLLSRLGQQIDFFEFATTTNEEGATTSVIYPYIEKGNMRIVKRGDELIAKWAGQQSNVPYYFCVTGSASSTITDRYGEHVAIQVEKQRLLTSPTAWVEGVRFCRNEIRLDRMHQAVQYYEFFPGSTDLVVIQLEDGLYVTEIDDRAWQNSQLIYPGSDFETIVTDTNIYIKQNDRYFELVTEILEL